jgi:hypothetical protein
MKVSQTSNGDGVVYFNADVTKEMQAQAVSFFSSNGLSIDIAPGSVEVEQ